MDEVGGEHSAVANVAGDAEGGLKGVRCGGAAGYRLGGVDVAVGVGGGILAGEGGGKENGIGRGARGGGLEGAGGAAVELLVDDGVGDLVGEIEAAAAADRGFAVAVGVVREAEAGGKVGVGVGVGGEEAGGGDVGGVVRAEVVVVADAKVQSQAGKDLPIVLRPDADDVASNADVVVAEGLGVGRGGAVVVNGSVVPVSGIEGAGGEEGVVEGA